MQKLRTWSCCCCLLLCSILLFAGCSTTSQYSVYYLDGSRSTEFQIKVDSAACQSAGINPNLVMLKIKNYADQQEDFLRAHGGSMTGVSIKHGFGTTDSYEYNFGLYFASFADYCTFFGITAEEIENSEPEIEEGLFVSQYIVQRTCLTDDAGNLVTSTLGIYIPYQTIYNDFLATFCGGDTAKCNDLMDSIVLGIVKCFPHEYGYRANASEAGTILMPKGVNATENNVAYSAFFWQGTLLNPPAEMVVYKNYITYQNRVAWYTLAIVLTIIFGLILTLVLCLKNKNAQQSSAGSDTGSTTDETTNQRFDIHTTQTDDKGSIVIEIKPNEQQNKQD